ncbi:MAG: polyprenyl synthetase family protein [Paludibacteraceae bacterium]|nr:polyprenyl synthetase family protein [Paludibacteraceae bacterium]
MNTLRQSIQSEFLQFDQAFSAALSSDNHLIDNILDYIHTKRGKQLRPVLVLLSAAICKGVTDKTINTAVSLELLHTASLIHDDVVDNSPMRRGVKSIHEQWNNKIAILVGDFLLAKVISLLTEIRNTSILSIVSEVGAALSSGELIQMHDGESMWITEEQYLRVIQHKTAHLFAACCEAGAVSSGATAKQSHALKSFGMYLGLCFQLKDDVFDYSDVEDLGKPTMNDLRDGKATLPIIISLQRASKEEATYIKKLAEDLTNQSPHINLFEAEQEIRSFVLRYDGIRYAYQIMEKYRKKALDALASFPDNKYKESLATLLDYAIQRMH